MNSAFVFVKPHAVTDATKALVKSGLEAKGIKITAEGALTAEQIDEGKLIDQHYYAIASKATILKPAQLNVPADKFKAQFGIEWQAALDSGKVLNALDGCAALGITADEMDAQWGICKKAKKLIKFGGGFYCGLIEIEGKESYYVFNGFFMSMRAKFTTPGTSIYYYVVEWDSSAVSWADFRGSVLGPTDPVEAPADSLRGQIYSKWESLGLAAVPDVGDNGVHASASPFEALAERANWVKADVATDSFGAQLVAAGVSVDTINAWSVDPQVLVGGEKGSLFDSVEDMDTAACIEKLSAISLENPAENPARAAALAAPAEEDIPKPAEKFLIYDDDEAIGKKAPTLGTLAYIKGEPVTMGAGKPVCIVFWSKAYKGDYTTLRDISKIADAFGNDIQFVGIGIDPSKADSESFLKKIGTKMPEIYIKKPLEVNFSLAYDVDLELKEAYKSTAKMLSLGASAVFLVAGDRTIVWREQFAPAPGHTVFRGQLQEQCRRLILGEALLSNGNRPVEDEEEMEEMDMGGGDDDFDW